MGFYLKTTKWFRWMYPKHLVWEIPNDENAIYLTFDDGPTPEVTEKALDLLKMYDAKATFFCLGKQVKAYPEIYQRILDEGHAVGNHTINHIKRHYYNSKSFIKEIDSASKLIDSHLFRPPYGQIQMFQARLLKDRYKIIMWSVLSGDFDEKVSKEDCVETVMKHTKSGSVIVFHDSVKAGEKMLYCLSSILEAFTQEGYIFKKIEEDC